MRAFLETAGESVAIESALPWVSDLLVEGAAGELSARAGGEASLQVQVEASRRPFATARWERLTRDAWRRNGEVVVENACTAGFDLHLRCVPGTVELAYRWRPPARDRVAARLLRSRFHLLARAVLVQYPALWWAGTRGRVPLHASACTVGSSTALLASAGGIGRSTLVLRELEAGGLATGDNLAVGDGSAVWGLVEPFRVEVGDGRRMPHGRQELVLPGRAVVLRPDTFVVLRRDCSVEPSLVRCAPEVATRSLSAATYMAGELRRYWAFAATLAAGTGIGPVHPAVDRVAAAYAHKLRCLMLVLGGRKGTRLADVLAAPEVAA